VFLSVTLSIELSMGLEAADLERAVIESANLDGAVVVSAVGEVFARVSLNLFGSKLRNSHCKDKHYLTRCLHSSQISGRILILTQTVGTLGKCKESDRLLITYYFLTRLRSGMAGLKSQGHPSRPGFPRDGVRFMRKRVYKR